MNYPGMQLEILALFQDAQESYRQRLRNKFLTSNSRHTAKWEGRWAVDPEWREKQAVKKQVWEAKETEIIRVRREAERARSAIGTEPCQICGGVIQLYRYDPPRHVGICSG